MTMPLTIARYEVLQRIGRGAMGSLYLARDPNLGRLIAIKIADLDPDGARRRFRREARAAGALGHPNIVAIFDYGEFNGAPFIVMEYIRGETLFELISRRATLALAQKLGLLEQLCRGLDYAHTAGIVHCDIKPGNLMIDQHGALKILDFGISRIAQVSLTPRGDLIGTPGYMSPEQIEERQIDGTSDLFAAGAVAYELLAYRAAFPGDSRREILHDIVHSAPTPILSLAPGIGAGVARIVERALEKSPAARYLVASSMQRDLQAAREALDREPASRLPSAELGTGSGLIQSEADDRELERERRAMAQRAATLAVNRGLQYLEERAWNAARRAAFEACALDPENAAATALHEAAEAGPKESTQVVQQYVVGGSHPLDRTATAGLGVLSPRSMSV
jgi:serine/threonine-protein kinase